MTRITAFLFSFLSLVALAFGQSTTPSTTFAAAMDTSTSVAVLTSGTGVVAQSQSSAGTVLVSGSESMTVTGNPSGDGVTFTVIRGTNGIVQQHASGDLVFTAKSSANVYITFDPGPGGCTATNYQYLPLVNTSNGNIWKCTNSQWQKLNEAYNSQRIVSPAVASAAGFITPSGPLFHITGTSAITGFNLPAGFTYGQICAIPDAIFTTTNANNIALASTAVVGKQLCWVYDPATAKFYPSY